MGRKPTTLCSRLIKALHRSGGEFMVVLVLLNHSMAALAGHPWPLKGDTVYIAASFDSLQAPHLISGAEVEYNMPPCKKVKVLKATPGKLKWITRDLVGGTEHLEGAWLGRMHRTEKMCKEQMDSEGEPVVKRSGSAFRIETVKPE